MSATKIVYSELRNFVNSQLNRIERFDKENNESLTMFFIKSRNKSDNEKIELIVNELRISDVLFQNDDNFIFVLQHTDGGGAVHIKKMVEEFFGTDEMPTSYASFPEDGKSIEELLSLIEEDIVDSFNISLKL
jgi:hypothetical protein